MTIYKRNSIVIIRVIITKYWIEADHILINIILTISLCIKVVIKKKTRYFRKKATNNIKDWTIFGLQQ